MGIVLLIERSKVTHALIILWLDSAIHKTSVRSSPNIFVLKCLIVEVFYNNLVIVVFCRLLVICIKPVLPIAQYWTILK